MMLFSLSHIHCPSLALSYMPESSSASLALSLRLYLLMYSLSLLRWIKGGVVDMGSLSVSPFFSLSPF